MDDSLESFAGHVEVFSLDLGPCRRRMTMWPVYAGATEDVEEAAEAADSLVSSPKGFFPQNRVVIMHSRNCLFMQM